MASPPLGEVGRGLPLRFGGAFVDASSYSLISPYGLRPKTRLWPYRLNRYLRIFYSLPLVSLLLPFGEVGRGLPFCYAWRVTLLLVARHIVTRGTSRCYAWQVTLLQVPRNTDVGMLFGDRGICLGDSPRGGGVERDNRKSAENLLIQVFSALSWVASGTRTHDIQNHNLTL